MVASAGITIGDDTGWFETLRWRYLDASPLTEDNAFRSQPTSIFNGRVRIARPKSGADSGG
jgi:hypothetical protein